MFKNLKDVLFQKGISIKNYAELMGIAEKTAQNKIYGKTEFTYSEFRKTCNLLPEYNADYLFSLLEQPQKTA